jgi:hypothetical protein
MLATIEVLPVMNPEPTPDVARELEYVLGKGEKIVKTTTKLVFSRGSLGIHGVVTWYEFLLSRQT